MVIVVPIIFDNTENSPAWHHNARKKRTAARHILSAPHLHSAAAVSSAYTRLTSHHAKQLFPSRPKMTLYDATPQEWWWRQQQGNKKQKSWSCRSCYVRNPWSAWYCSDCGKPFQIGPAQQSKNTPLKQHQKTSLAVALGGNRFAEFVKSQKRDVPENEEGDDCAEDDMALDPDEGAEDVNNNELLYEQLNMLQSVRKMCARLHATGGEELEQLKTQVEKLQRAKKVSITRSHGKEHELKTLGNRRDARQNAVTKKQTDVTEAQEILDKLHEQIANATAYHGKAVAALARARQDLAAANADLQAAQPSPEVEAPAAETATNNGAQPIQKDYANCSTMMNLLKTEGGNPEWIESFRRVTGCVTPPTKPSLDSPHSASSPTCQPRPPSPKADIEYASRVHGLPKQNLAECHTVDSATHATSSKRKAEETARPASDAVHFIIHTEEEATESTVDHLTMPEGLNKRQRRLWCTKNGYSSVSEYQSFIERSETRPAVAKASTKHRLPNKTNASTSKVSKTVFQKASGRKDTG